MTKKPNKKSNIINFRLTSKREELISKLASIEAFQYFQRKIPGKDEKQLNLAEVFDKMLETAVNHPEYFRDELLQDQENVYQLLNELRGAFLESNQLIGQIFKDFDGRIERIETLLEDLNYNLSVSMQAMGIEQTKHKKNKKRGENDPFGGADPESSQ